jgi:hypothetical protein
MSTNFAGVVDEVRELSFEERRELLDVIEQSLIDERRDEILKNGEEARQAFANGELKFYSNVDDLMESLND